MLQLRVLGAVLAGMALLLFGIRESHAADWQSSVQLEVGAVYELAGQPTVAIRLTNLLSDQRIMLPFENPSPENWSGIIHQVRLLGDVSLPFTSAAAPVRTTALYPCHTLVLEVRNPFGTRDIEVAFPFQLTCTGERRVIAVKVPGFAARLLRTPISAREAERIAKEAGFPFELDQNWMIEYGYVEWLGRVWELSAHVSGDSASGVQVDTLAFVDAFTGESRGLSSRRILRTVAQ
jgi:hypothetical protein